MGKKITAKRMKKQDNVAINETEQDVCQTMERDGKPYQCNICTVQRTSLRLLSYHLEEVHDVLLNEKIKLRHKIRVSEKKSKRQSTRKLEHDSKVSRLEN